MSDIPIVLLVHTHNRSDCLVEVINSVHYHHPNLKGFHKTYLIDDFTTPERDYSVFKYDTPQHIEGAFIYSDPKEKINGIEYAQQRGFELIHRNDEQRGCWKTLSSGLNKIKEEVPENSLILYLQNDCKLVRPVPFQLIQTLFNSYNVSLAYLFGPYISARNKRRSVPSFNKLHAHTQKIGDETVCLDTGGFYHAQPHIAKLEYLLEMVTGAKREAQVRTRSKNQKYNHLVYAKIMENVTETFGYYTPFGKYGQHSKESRYKKLVSGIKPKPKPKPRPKYPKKSKVQKPYKPPKRK